MNLKFIILSIGWTFIILYFTLTPNPSGASWLPDVPHIDKLAHAIMFMILSIIVFKSHHGDSGKVDMRKITLAYCLLLAMITECGQIYVPDRSFEYFDIIADFSGGIAGIFAIRYVK